MSWQQGYSQEQVSIIPQPTSLLTGSGTFQANSTTRLQVINYGKDAEAVRFNQIQIFGEAYNLPPIVTGKMQNSNVVVLQIDQSMSNVKGAYSLSITPNRILIKSQSDEGIFYGIQTLKQLIPIGSTLINTKLPALEISDSPKFQWRGMHLDVSRHFFSLDYLKTYIDRLAGYKFNKFHLHLSDDQGWRIEIDKYPNLTKTGAWRDLNDQDSSCLRMAKTNPDFNLPENFFKTIDGKQKYGGFYTKAEMRALIAYAAQRKVTIVPEIDMPGHMMAAIQSYPGLTCGSQTSWGKTFSTPLCPCKEEVYTFVQNVLTEIADLFPSEYIHIGADEVEKTTWESSAGCQALMKKEGIENVAQLQSYFVKRIEKFLQSKGKKMIGWDEVLEGGVSPSTTVMYWRGWEKDAPKVAAKNGNNVIMTPTDYSYFDYPQDARTLERLYKARVIPEGLTPAEQNNIIGVQGNLWTEYIPTTARLEYMLFPRALALAELAWSSTSDFSDFTKRMDQHFRRLDAMNINFRMPDIVNLQESVVFTDSTTLTLNKPNIVSSIRYTTDGTDPLLSSAAYLSPIKIYRSQNVKIAAFTDRNRKGEVFTISFDKQTYLPPLPAMTNLQQGLRAVYVEGKIANLKSLPSLTPVKQYTLQGLAIPSDHRKGSFGMVYTGFIQIEKEGIYTFYLNADDGASLTIGNRLVVDNDGPHSPKEKSGQIALGAGIHAFTIPFFEAGGGYTLGLRWEGPGIPLQKFPDQNFFYKN